MVKKTADALNITRPISFKELLAKKHASARKLKVKSCLLPETLSELTSPDELDEWITVEHSMSTSMLDLTKDSEWRNQRGQLNPDFFSCLKDRLAIDSPLGTERRHAFRARGLSAGSEKFEPPVSPPPGRPPEPTGRSLCRHVVSVRRDILISVIIPCFGHENTALWIFIRMGVWVRL